MSGEGAAGVGFERLGENLQGAGKVGFRQHICQPHFVAAEAWSGVEA